MNDSIKTIFKNAGRFFSGTMISRFAGVIRDVVMAAAFGASSSVAALMVAYRLSHLLRRLLGEGALQTAFIPLFEDKRTQSPAAAFGFYREIARLLFILLFGLVAAASAAIMGYLYFLHPSEGNGEIAWLMLLLMPSLFFICFYGLNAALLQCENHYFTASVAPVAFNIAWIAAVLGLWHLDAKQAMPLLAGAIVGGCFLQWMMTARKVRQMKRLHPPEKSRMPLNEGFPFLKPLMLCIAGVAAAQINSACDTLFARYAAPEGPAYLWYAIRLQQLPIGVFGVALSGALLPPLARAVKEGASERFLHFFSVAVKSCIALLLPISIAFFVAGDSCINLIFGHGHFTDEATTQTTYCLWGYSVGLLPMGLVLLSASTYYARGDFKTPARATACSVVVNILFNALFVMGMGWGPASIALATGISSWVNLLILWRKTSAYKSLHMIAPTLLRAIAASATGVLFVLNFSNVVALTKGAPLDFPRELFLQVRVFAIQALLFGLPILLYWRREFLNTPLGDPVESNH